MNKILPRPWPKNKIDEIKKAIDKALEAGASPVAAFDADGTLWHADMGENLFEYTFKNHLIAGLPDDPWQYYLDAKDVNESNAFLWLAQIYDGLPISTVREWAHEALDSISPVPVFDGIKEIIAHLKSAGVRVHIVTASIKWAVEPGAELLGLTADDVIGIRTQVINDIVTTYQEGPITWREGKVKGILEATHGVHPFFAAGNTMGDLALLESATHLRLVNAAAAHDEVNFETEHKMLEIARERGWFFHDYK